MWPQDERGLLDLESLLKEPKDNTLVYCCGPEGLLDGGRGALRAMAFGDTPRRTVRRQGTHRRASRWRHWSSLRWCASAPGVTFEVTSDKSILEILEEADVPIMASCYEGVCGTCEARVLEGTPDHRDSMLTDAEKDAGEVMLVCVSRSRTERLVLDL